jgi:hypothetical protein
MDIPETPKICITTIIIIMITLNQLDITYLNAKLFVV